MVRRMLLIAFVMMLVFSASQVFAEYNTETVVRVMRGNVKLMGQLKSAIADKDSFTAADAFMELARGANKIKDYTPKRGSSDDWKKTNEQLINTAFRGIGALAAGNWEGVAEAYAEIGGLGKKGHSNHR
jgi:hypothetical protein